MTNPHVLKIACMTSRRYCHFTLHAFKKLHVYTTDWTGLNVYFELKGNLTDSTVVLNTRETGHIHLHICLIHKTRFTMKIPW